MELQYQKSNDSWGISAQSATNQLVFSGTFDANRINAEKNKQIIHKIVSFILWAITFLGLISLLLEFANAFKTQNLLFLFDVNLYNLIISFAIFCSIYIWARAKQKNLNEQITPNTKNPIDVYQLFTDQTKNIWDNTLNIAKKKGREPSCQDVFESLLVNKSMDLAFLRLGITPRQLLPLLNNSQPDQSSDYLLSIPFAAAAKTLELHATSIQPIMILSALLAVLPQDHIIQNIFFNLNISTSDINLLSSWITSLNSLSQNWDIFKKLAKFKPDNEINIGLTSVPTPYLDKFSTDLTRQAKYGSLPPTVGRNKDLQNILKLLGETTGNLLIKGATGSGRTTLINELAFKMASEQVPQSLQDQRLVKLEISSILGTVGKSEAVLNECLAEAAKSGNIVLVMEEVQSLAKTKTSQGLSLLEFVIDFLSQSGIRVIATTTLEDYTENLQKLLNFDQTFPNYELEELNKDQLLLACAIRASLLESQYHCFFELKAIVQAFDLTEQYIQNLSQPQKTIAVLVEAASKAKTKGKKYQRITPEQISEIISTKTHIPSQTFSETEADKLLKLESELAKSVVGQKAAVTAVAEGLRRARSGLALSSRPLASFLFLGPTGVGKTELAKTIASVYFGKPEYLLRLDMSEYSGSDALTKLLGNTNGPDSPMVSHIKNYPFCLLLLDEFEKATSEVHNIFLQILDDGRLTSTSGETLKLNNTMVIATSNAGTSEIQEGIKLGNSTEQIKTTLMNTTLQKIFRPELLNRFDGVIVFSPLSRDEVKQVTDLQLEYLRTQLLQKGIKLKFTQAVIAQISQNAFDPLLGARPIRRYIQDNVESFISKLILSKKLVRGTSVTVDFTNGSYALKN